MIYTTDSNIEQYAWSTHIPSDGSDIGGCDPASYSLDQTFSAMRLMIEGTKQQGGYPTFEAFIDRPVQQNTGNLNLSFDLTPNSNLANMDLFETDCKLSIGGYTNNFSLQVLTSSWELQISNQAGDWVSTGIVVPAFVPNVTQHYSIRYQFDTSTKKYSIIAVSINGVINLIPTDLQNLTANKTGWSDGAVLQQQRTLTPAAGNAGKSAADDVDNVTLTWF